MKGKKEIKILNFHKEELIFVLIILATNLKSYEDDDLKNFAEAIHRIETLLQEKFLRKLQIIGVELSTSELMKFKILENKVIKLFSSHWYKKLKTLKIDNPSISVLAKELLKIIEIEYQEPLLYAEEHMEIDW